MKTIEGMLAGVKGRFAIVAGRFNGFVVESLVHGARDSLVRHAVDDEQVALGAAVDHFRRFFAPFAVDVFAVGVRMFGDVRIRRDHRIVCDGHNSSPKVLK